MTTILEILTAHKAYETTYTQRLKAIRQQERDLMTEHQTTYDAMLEALITAHGWTPQMTLKDLESAEREINNAPTYDSETRSALLTAIRRVIRRKECGADPLIQAFRRILSDKFNIPRTDVDEAVKHLRSTTVRDILVAAGHSEEEIRCGCDVWSGGGHTYARVAHLANLVYEPSFEEPTEEEETRWMKAQRRWMEAQAADGVPATADSDSEDSQ
jgi:hypothetical protein